MSVEIANLSACTEDARFASLDPELGPAEPVEYPQLLERLHAARSSLPPIYRDAVHTPFLARINALGQEQFAEILRSDPDRMGGAGLMLDIAQAILQNAEGYASKAADAFQEVVSDLYDGFLSEEDRRGINPPEGGELPPLVKWGNPLIGPYVWPIDATRHFDLKAAVVSLPPPMARRGLMAWAALAHETVGHAFLHADEGLREEMAEAVRTALKAKKSGGILLADYWAGKIDETASDLLGIANMGPTAGMGMLSYFRGLRQAWGESAQLGNEGSMEDAHPIDLLRGYLAAAAVEQLSFKEAKDWAAAIEKEVEKDFTAIKVDGTEIKKTEAIESARIVAKTVLTTRLKRLEYHSVLDIQDWHDRDQEIANALEGPLTTLRVPPSLVTGGIYAAHVVAAGVQASLRANANLASIFDRMVALLVQMHQRNPAWGPLMVRYRGNISMRRAGSGTNGGGRTWRL